MFYSVSRSKPTILPRQLINSYFVFIDDLNFTLQRLSINFYTQSDHEILKNFYSNIVKLSLINSSEFT